MQRKNWSVHIKRCWFPFHWNRAVQCSFICCSVDSAPKVRHMFMKFWDFTECIYICNTGHKCKALSGVWQTVCFNPHCQIQLYHSILHKFTHFMDISYFWLNNYCRIGFRGENNDPSNDGCSCWPLVSGWELHTQHITGEHQEFFTCDKPKRCLERNNQLVLLSRTDSLGCYWGLWTRLVIGIYILQHVRTRVCVCVCARDCMHIVCGVCVHVCMRACMCVHTYICVFSLSVHTCVHIHIMYTQINLFVTVYLIIAVLRK